MAMKKRSLPQDQKKSNDDIVIYKIMTVLAALCMLLLSLQMLSRVYRLSENRFIVRPYIGGAAVVFAVLAVVLFLCYRARRTSSRFWKLAGVQLGVASLVAALSCWLLYATWISYLAALYFAYVAAAILYMIALLYQHEFFLLTVINLCAGCTFYGLSRLYGEQAEFSLSALLLNILLVAVAAVGAGLSFAANRRGGKLRLAGRERRFFSRGFSPLPIYISCAVWLACLIASALLGSVFAYYCIFAVASFELIAAVYYTVKLS